MVWGGLNVRLIWEMLAHWNDLSDIIDVFLVWDCGMHYALTSFTWFFVC